MEIEARRVMCLISLVALQLAPPIEQAPAIRVKTSELFLNREKCARVAYRGCDFQPVSNDRRIHRQLLDATLGIACDLLRIELAESVAITFAFFENDRPTE